MKKVVAMEDCPCTRTVLHRETNIFEGGWGGHIVSALCTCMPAHQAVAWTCATEAMILRKILIREMADTQAP